MNVYGTLVRETSEIKERKGKRAGLPIKSLNRTSPKSCVQNKTILLPHSFFFYQPPTMIRTRRNLDLQNDGKILWLTSNRVTWSRDLHHVVQVYTCVTEGVWTKKQKQRTKIIYLV